MTIIVGADRLGNIKKLLKERGISEFKHISGRHAKAQSGSLVRAKLMILFTDFVGHNVMYSFRKQARAQKIPFIACRRSVSDLARCLDRAQLVY